MLPLTKRQREILDYLNEFITQHGYAPSLEEIGKRFGLSSLATVHTHLTNLQEKGLVKRAWNRSRALELVPSEVTVRAVEVPLPAEPQAATNAAATSHVARCNRFILSSPHEFDSNCCLTYQTWRSTTPAGA